MPAEAVARGDRDPAKHSDLLTEDEYAQSHGEPLSHTLDLATWAAGVDLGELYQRLELEVAPALAQERRVQEVVRHEIFPLLPSAPEAPGDAGIYRAGTADLEAVHRKVLFSGQLEACDGTTVTHDSLLLTVTQIGICLVSYQGSELSLSQRLFRRDLRSAVADPVAEARGLLERRKGRSAVGVQDKSDTLSELGRRGIMTYAERATLLHKSTAEWRMGHGNIAPYELLTGSGFMELLEASLQLLSELVEYERFVFVPSTIKDRLLQTLGDALEPLEYAVVSTTRARMAQIVDNGRYNPRYRRLAEDFVQSVGPKVVLGMYRASAHAPAHPFFAHVDRVHEAAHIAIADSVLQEHRGFPMSIDLADSACSAMFSPTTFESAVAAAYSEHGEPTRYLTERSTREK